MFFGFSMYLPKKLLRFVIFGIPAFLIAIPLNLLLVEIIEWPKPVAYALVLIVQVTINFFICIHYVFERDTTRHLLSQLTIFMSGILAVRCLDWGLYTLLVRVTPIHYIIIQFFNVIVFSIAKFAFARRTIEGRNPRP